MIGKLNHIAIAVPDLDKAIALYRDVLGAIVSEVVDLPGHGVTVAFINLPNTKIELLYPLGDSSPITSYLNKNNAGGMHHICYEVDDILSARDNLLNKGMRILGSNEPSIGAHGKPVLFLHPKDFCGTLIELEQV
ncbi:MAG: methylmalonyl-CoA epimerase [Kordiimonadaceae bacterium]|jgi:methylmalonyl-CoA/ethylmalonyl-CoA epimerase|nr:methylmalonyl-CoA epimerase [Kordiimonadaceae bacterium]MBT6031499.1 methylmalonyl-CoA epimerase [Kordiimonadaceae bacterium]